MQLFPWFTPQDQGDSKLCSWTYNITLGRTVGYNLTILKIPSQQVLTPTRETERETRLPLETKHMVDGNNVIRP